MFVLWKATKLGSHFLCLPTSVGITIFFLDYDLCQPDVHLPWGVTKKSSPGVVSHVGLHGGIGRLRRTLPRGIILELSSIHLKSSDQRLNEAWISLQSWNSWKQNTNPHFISFYDILCAWVMSSFSLGSTAARSSHAVALNWTATPNRWTPGIGSGCRFRKCRRGLRGSWEESELHVDFTQNCVVCGVFSRREWWNLMEFEGIILEFWKNWGKHQPQQPLQGIHQPRVTKGSNPNWGVWPAKKTWQCRLLNLSKDVQRS